MKADCIYLEEPDYRRPLIKLTKVQLKSLYENLFELYGRWHAADVLDELVRMIEVHGAHRQQALESADVRKRADGFDCPLVFGVSYPWLRAQSKKKREKANTHTHTLTPSLKTQTTI